MTYWGGAARLQLRLPPLHFAFLLLIPLILLSSYFIPSFSTGIVKPPSMRLSSMDRSFVHNVINGMGGKDEIWVRQQFSNYTKYALETS